MDHSAKTRIAGHHATLKLHNESCRISLQARHTTIISRNGAKAFRHPESFLLEPGEIILLGNGAYTFGYTDYFRSRAFNQAITQYMREYRESSWSMNEYISPSSVGLATKLGEYYCSPTPFNQGTFGKVSAGWTKTGERVPDAYCVYTPHALANLSEVINSYTPDTSAKSALFTDYLSGLSYLHNHKRIMHRDISPGNLAITSLHEPKGIIIDLDAATASKISTDHMKGTLPCLALEIMKLKAWNKIEEQPRPYEKSVDTLGLIMYFLYTNQSFDWAPFGAIPSLRMTTTVTETNHKNFHEKLEKLNKYTKNAEIRIGLAMVARLTAWDAADRYSASDALKAFSQIRRGKTRGTMSPKGVKKRRWAGD
ncbi:MAG: hypothetical protein Q9213_002134 [Squamulea squamosa]